MSHTIADLPEAMDVKASNLTQVNRKVTSLPGPLEEGTETTVDSSKYMMKAIEVLTLTRDMAEVQADLGKARTHPCMASMTETKADQIIIATVVSTLKRYFFRV